MLKYELKNHPVTSNEIVRNKTGDDQQQIEINNKKFVADKKFILLIRELNKVGLQTLGHCCGKGKDVKSEHCNISYLLFKRTSNTEIIVDDKHFGIYWKNIN